MSSPLRAALLTALLIAVQPSRLAAQQVHEQEVARLRAEIDRIEPRLIVLRRLDSLYSDSVNRAAIRKHDVVYDSAMIGPFQVFGSKSNVKASMSDARTAWTAIQPLFRNLESDAQGVVLAVNRTGYFAVAPLRGEVQFVTLLSDRHDLWRDAYENAMAATLAHRLPVSVKAWLGERGGIGTQHLDAVFRTLVLGQDANATSRGQELDCSTKNVQACRRALTLDPADSVMGNALLRTSFISFVVYNAPSGSIAASSTDTADVVTAIEHLSGKPIDSLIADWVAYVERGTPHGFTDVGRYLATTIVWLVAFGALAMRSTRWRLG